GRAPGGRRIGGARLAGRRRHGRGHPPPAARPGVARHRLHARLGRGREPRTAPAAPAGLHPGPGLHPPRPAGWLPSRQGRRGGARPLRRRAQLMQALQVPVHAGAHRWELIARIPAAPRLRVLWLPALGVSARHYLPLAEALAGRGAAVFLHEWRGAGSSNLRAGRDCDWGYRELLAEDIPASVAAMREALPGVATTRLGGHSLGGQLASCSIALQPGYAQGLWLVGSGAPYWRAFPAPLRWGLPLV